MLEDMREDQLDDRYEEEMDPLPSPSGRVTRCLTQQQLLTTQRETRSAMRALSYVIIKIKNDFRRD